MNGGALVFEMGSKPSDWANKSIPPSKIEQFKIVTIPYYMAESQTFSEQMEVALGSAVGGEIYYSINGSAEEKYESPLIIKRDSEIKCHTFKNKKWRKNISRNHPFELNF